jgi:hypothetical protein
VAHDDDLLAFCQDELCLSAWEQSVTDRQAAHTWLDWMTAPWCPMSEASTRESAPRYEPSSLAA